MASRRTTSIAIFLVLNLVLFNFAFATNSAQSLDSCPSDALELNVCADVLDFVHLRIGSSKRDSCCGIVGNLISLNASTCLCTAVHANILGLVNLDLSVALNALINFCGSELPNGFHCPPLQT
ncbi:putative lipid-binding protein AIR1 [Chenopodium quinoa]|uniref:Bifunctional inhibitor/plant lipid transfer protein/seed storage helical domain-containing protein n=1 Tax=Chenopodium quinoa TaxID=63459 RepID=A0A803LZL5_CHEQI|nr:putative lipid-binding protein AIR1 [Chenopodium quinoa]